VINWFQIRFNFASKFKLRRYTKVTDFQTSRTARGIFIVNSNPGRAM